jgi:glycosyltransferase involved in cell wall biosynthesis
VMDSPLPPWVLVCGGFHPLGGMDQSNYALATRLVEQGRTVHLVCHQIASDLAAHPSVRLSAVPRPFNSILLGEAALRRTGLKVAREVTSQFPRARVVVNGGNCDWPGINWVHSVHSCWPRSDNNAPVWFRAKNALNKWKARRDEQAAFQLATHLIANSRRTAHDLTTIGVPTERIHTIYLGSGPDWRPASASEKLQARTQFQLPPEAKVIGFVGALGYDRNKGFDTLLAAFERLPWSDLYLIAAGGGRGWEQWRAMVQRHAVAGRVRLIGFTDRISEVYAACDLLVSPVRYEAFGLNVQEAICRGVPCIVSSTAGIAELYPPELQEFLQHNPENIPQLTDLIRKWYTNGDAARRAFEPLCSRLRARTWREMAEDIIALVESDSARVAAVQGGR